MGHDTVKCARIGEGNDWTSQLNHFEIPTVIVPELMSIQQDLMKQQASTFDRRLNTNFQFFKQNIDSLTERVISQYNSEPKRSYHQRPMINGLLQEDTLRSFTQLWEHIGRMFVQGMNLGQTDDIRASWGSLHSRLLMTDPSFTMAAGDHTMIGYAAKQRCKIAEVAFEELGVSEFSLQPAQLPQLMSELCMDGIVVDLGHEMTQIVPIQGAMTNIRKTRSFAVGGITMDSILMKQLRSKYSDSLASIYSESKYTHFWVRTKIKEELPKLRKRENPNLHLESASGGGTGKSGSSTGLGGSKNQVLIDSSQQDELCYILPDQQRLVIDWQSPHMSPIDCYLEGQAYAAYHDSVILPLYRGRSTKVHLMQAVQRSCLDSVIQQPQAYLPESRIATQTLNEKFVEEQESNFPITNKVLQTVRDYCEDEEIKEFSQLQNILITGGGANITYLIPQSHRKNWRNQTLGQLVAHNLKEALAAEQVTGLNVLLSQDPRLAILQGARLLMSLSSNQKHFVTAADYFENGSPRFELINQILI